MTSIKKFPNVKIQEPASIEDFVILGKLPKDSSSLETAIDINAIIRSHTVIYAGNSIGKNFQTGHHVLIRESNQIGDNVSIGSSSVIEHHVKIGNNVRIHSQAFIPEYSILEDDCWIGPNVVLTNAKYPCSPDVKANLLGPRIKKGAKICANVTILPGVIIGENALIAAGAVVTKDVPDNAVVMGVSGQVIKDIGELPY